MTALPAISYRILSPSDFTALHRGFLSAFSTYPANVQPSPDDLRLRFKRIGLDYHLSVGAFAGEEIVGFILTGRGGFKGVPTAYNAGTGVHPDYRRQGIARDLYQFLFPELKKQGLGQCLLEVIEDNTPALSFYESLGFEKVRLLRCYANPDKLRASPEYFLPEPINIREVSLPDWISYEQLGRLQPSWQNTPLAVERVRQHEVVLEAYWQTDLIGFIIFSPDNGRISQLAVLKDYRQKGIGRALLFKAQQRSQQRLSILNVGEEHKSTGRFFQHLGFRKPFSQWEMKLDLY